MKFLTIILLFISSLSFSQEIKKMTVVFTDISVDQAEGGSFYMEYKDSSGNVHYSDMRFEEDIFLNYELLYDYEGGLLVYFNEDWAKECVNREVIVWYEEKEVKYFGVVPFVTNMEFKDW